MVWRRDVRRFKTEPVPADLLESLLDIAQLAPSVGNSQPWRWISVESPALREAMRDNFRRCNADALAAQPSADRAALYARLKLSGMDAAPVQLACFCDTATPQGAGLGRRTMPAALHYSVAGMLAHLWLAARAAGVGVGWVTVLDPARAARDLAAPEGWELVAYLCVGWPEEEHPDPELVRHGWQPRTADGRRVLVR